MDKFIARTMVEALYQGINPIDGTLLPETDACSNSEIQEALFEVLESCTIESNEQLLKRLKKEKKEQAKQKLEKNKAIYENAGTPWKKREIEKLKALNLEYNIWYTANVLGRSPKAIASKLSALGIIPNRTRRKIK